MFANFRQIQNFGPSLKLAGFRIHYPLRLLPEPDCIVLNRQLNAIYTVLNWTA